MKKIKNKFKKQDKNLLKFFPKPKMFTYLLTYLLTQTEKTHMRSHGKKPNGRTEVAREWANVGNVREEVETA